MIKIFHKHPGILVLLILVLLADLVFWGQNFGISIAVFALALSAAILTMKPGGATGRQWRIALGCQVVLNLPVVEQVQLLSLIFTGIGIGALVVWVTYGRLVAWWRVLLTMIRISTVGAVLLPFGLAKAAGIVKGTEGVEHHLKALILPFGIGLVFLLLLTPTNPWMLVWLLDGLSLVWILDGLSNLALLWALYAHRIIFWLAAASLIWPYLNLSQTWLGPAAASTKHTSPRLPWLRSLVTAESVRNSLILFNLLFLVQTITDIGVLIGGMSPPVTMTYALYAQRGAYPLVAAALLAGIFTIVTYRMVGENRILKSLLFLWLAQSLFLVVTAAFRLSLYIDAYGLTYLRVAAFVWMGLVFSGLVLIIVQIIRSYSVGWLMRSNLAALAGTFYLCCFVNFAWVIADYNLRNSNTTAGLDAVYICALGEHALPLILEHDRATGQTLCDGYYGGTPQHTPIENFLEWGFREWRLQVTLEKGNQEQMIDLRPDSGLE